jgi:serine/threonine-protein kinase
MSLNIGDVIDDKYRILRLVGEGGMGAVYEGENRLISRRVAIKVLYGVASMSQDAIQRFEREAQAAGRIGNDHILEIIDLGRLPDGSRYMVMEYLDGETLGARIKRIGKMSPKDLVPVFKQVLTGLQAAHDAGIVHRDLKPDNIMIIDFGISKFQDPSDHNMTRTGTVMGTPFYMSPEQAKGVGVDRRSDLYAVGAMLYEAVSGSVPFDGKTFNELMFKIVLSDPRPLADLVPDLDPGFASCVLKGMARDAQHRFQSARDFSVALERWSSTGAAVTLPPEAGNLIAEFGATQLPSGQVPTGLTPGGAAHTPLQGSPGTLAGSGSLGGANPVGASTGSGGVTHGSWANSHTAAPNAGQRKWLPLAVAGGGVAVIGLVAALAMSGGDKPSDSSAVPAAAPEPKAEPKVEKPVEPPPAPAASGSPSVRPIANDPAATTAAPSAAPPSPTPSATAAKKPTVSAPTTATPAKPAVPKKPKAKVDFGY